MIPVDSAKFFVARPQSEHSIPSIREKYSSFGAYIQERREKNGPVDLIVGRGINCSFTPKLKATRLQNGEEVSYCPFTIDIDPKQDPDLLSDVRNIHSSLPFCSVDEIYLERIFPPIYLDLHVYEAAAKVLKVGGEMIIDYNDGSWDESLRKEQALIIKNALLTLNIPFELSFIEGGNYEYQRNSEGFAALRCVKVADFDSKPGADLFLRAERTLSRWNGDIERDNAGLQKAILFSKFECARSSLMK